VTESGKPGRAGRPEQLFVPVLALLARAADLPDLPALQAHLEETQRQVQAYFKRISGKGP
jgi:hypothetical protein